MTTDRREPFCIGQLDESLDVSISVNHDHRLVAVRLRQGALGVFRIEYSAKRRNRMLVHHVLDSVEVVDIPVEIFVILGGPNLQEACLSLNR